MHTMVSLAVLSIVSKDPPPDVTYQPNLQAKLGIEFCSTLVKATAPLMATNAAVKRACPADLKPGTLRTRRFLPNLLCIVIS